MSVDETLFDGDEIYASDNGNDEDLNVFDQIIGALEDILMEPTFQDIMDNFCSSNCDIFEDTEENKHEYMTIFSQYQSVIEKYLDDALRKHFPEVSLEAVGKMIIDNSNDVSPDLIDMFTSFNDFAEFKSLMLSHKPETTSTGGLSINGVRI